MSEFSPLVALSQNLADTVEQAGRSVVAVNARRGIASSGIHWQAGAIITSDENLKREEGITVALADGRTVPVTLVGRDPSTDVAVLRLETPAEIPVATVDATSELKVGQIVLAVGRSSDRGLTASMGIIGYLGDAWHSMSGGFIDRFIRLDLNLFPNQAGGALVNTEGRVAGMNTHGSRGQVLAIPAVTVNRVVEQLLARGRVERGYLGLGMQPVLIPDSLKQALALPASSGVMAINVEPDGPADRAGILLGDILIAIDGKTIGDTSDVQAQLSALSAGVEISTQVVRGGVLVTSNITLGERPRRSK